MIKVGDKVAYSARWLRSVGLAHTDYAHARGTVCEIRGQVAVVAWDRGGIPNKVLLANLAKVGPNRRFCHVD